MSLQQVAVALRRVASVLERRPSAGLHDDAAAMARWDSGTRVVASHASGFAVETDMPAELGGSGDRVSPGWMFRAGVASCAATSIAFVAAVDGVALTKLEVWVGSRSDTRGILGMNEADGKSVYAGPTGIILDVSIAALDVPEAQLRALVEKALQRSPIPNATRQATPLVVHINTAKP